MKQVIVVNRSLKLPKGKLAAQVAHAAVAAFLTTDSEIQQQWLSVGMPKVVLQAADLEQLQQLASCAQDAGIAAQLIQDAGRTVIKAGTTTCLGIGPAPVAIIDQICGDLKLL